MNCDWMDLGFFAFVVLVLFLLVSVIILCCIEAYDPCMLCHSGDRYCRDCGKELYSVCPVCDERQNGDFCEQCGYDFSN